jgi:hypothetical protein
LTCPWKLSTLENTSTSRAHGSCIWITGPVHKRTSMANTFMGEWGLLVATEVTRWTISPLAICGIEVLKDRSSTIETLNSFEA